ncbi:DUF4468 domain-containing protein [Aequorivita sp. F47161]|uniref:DUF4468 domain-containing protein n=1 Tax=Aequorivita vitellina TaxID=2874475 RepID=A0A9X1QWG0_9FLAO|nr:DUF4468 domain-containing protein [Aequorivita vitellina]MCG2419995.1 DUF4468 domain-containing protein [Aequorivita vitellina]
MKKIILLLAVLSSSIVLAQDIPQLKITPNGVEPIVVEVDSLTASDIYKKALNWVQETYKNPDKVLKANITDEKIRIDGFANSAFWWQSLGIKQTMDMEYTIEISFKDGKYRLEYIVGQFYVPGGQRALYTYSSFFKKSGEVRKAYDDAIPSIEQTMNELSLSLYNYVSGKTSKVDKDW